jgi:polyketide cyclase/dehydrase/lipid transport protein
MGQCYNSIVVTASVEDVWNTLRNFHELSWASGVVDSVEVIGNLGAHDIGARRRLNGVFHETLTKLNDAERTLSYTIDEGPGPLTPELVDRFTGTVQAFPVTATGDTFVLWTSDYATQDDTAVGEFCNPIYQALLEALAKHFA